MVIFRKKDKQKLFLLYWKIKFFQILSFFVVLKRKFAYSIDYLGMKELSGNLQLWIIVPPGHLPVILIDKH